MHIAHTHTHTLQTSYTNSETMWLVETELRSKPINAYLTCWYHIRWANMTSRNQSDHMRTESSCNLYSYQNINGEQLVSHFHKKTIKAYASPYLWNQLPSSFRQPHSVHCPLGSPHPAYITSSQLSSTLSPSITPSVFHSRLKTHLFHKYFPPYAM